MMRPMPFRPLIWSCLLFSVWTQAMAVEANYDYHHLQAWVQQTVRWLHTPNNTPPARPTISTARLQAVQALHVHGFAKVEIIGGASTTYAKMRDGDLKMTDGHAYFEGHNEKARLRLHWAHRQPLVLYANGQQEIRAQRLDSLPVAIFSSGQDHIHIAGRNLKLAHVHNLSAGLIELEGARGGSLDLRASRTSQTHINGRHIQVAAITARQQAKIWIQGAHSYATNIRLKDDSQLKLQGRIGAQQIIALGHSRATLGWLDTTQLDVQQSDQAHLDIAGQVHTLVAELHQDASLNAPFLAALEARVVTRQRARAILRPIHELNALALGQSSILYTGHRQPHFNQAYMGPPATALWLPTP